MDNNEIEILSPSSYCTYSVLENKQRTITKNQNILDDKLNRILKILTGDNTGEKNKGECCKEK